MTLLQISENKLHTWKTGLETTLLHFGTSWLCQRRIQKQDATPTPNEEVRKTQLHQAAYSETNKEASL